MKISTVFLDRDGVLNVDDPNYILQLDEALIHDDVPQAIKQLSDQGLHIIIISNQACIGKGLLSRRTAEAIFDEIITLAESQGGKITDYYYCPQTKEDACNCRKTGIALFLRAQRKYQFNMNEAVFVGDGYADAEAAKHLKIPFYLVEQGWGKVTKVKCDASSTPYIQVKNLQDAVDKILAQKENEK